ncbi:MAG TPA: glycosyltransferase family 39 protein [Gemmataceae bacterium]|nr:glycosyltransferase family 39 protein [Gemmataceae bacterium]
MTWKLAAGLLAVGLAWRLLRYFLQFPLWGDEASIVVNLLDRGYLDLLKPLDYKQVAPVLFLWSELTAYRLLGGSELAIRLLPFLAGVGSLFLFWRLARSSLNHVAALLAVGIFAVSYYPIRHSCEVKPYAFDLFWSLALLVPAVNWLVRPKQWAWLALLAALVPMALGASYPSVFVAGTVSLVLLKTAWERREFKTWMMFALYNLAMGISFLIFYRAAGAEQFDSSGGTANWYWSEWFPPSRPAPLIRWLASVHTGNMMAYPAGGSGGASALTLIFCLLGIWQLRKDRSILLLCLLPFGLTFLAAAMHHYPYGGSARVAQHLAPAICLLAGIGAAALIDRFAKSEIARRRSLVGVSAMLAIIGIAGMARDWKRSYKTPADAQLRDLVVGITRQAKPNDQIVVMDAPEEVASQFVWYLGQLKDRVAWRGQTDWGRFNDSPPHNLWCLFLTRDLSRRDAVMSALAPARHPLVLAGHEEFNLQFGQSYETLEHCEVFHWIGLPKSNFSSSP